MWRVLLTLLLLLASGAAHAGTKWDSGNCDSHYNLSNHNIFATLGTNTANATCNGTTSQSSTSCGGSGKCYFEIAAITQSSTTFAGGIAGSSRANNATCTEAGNANINGVNVGVCPTWGTPYYLYVAVDYGNNLIWFSTNRHSGTWNAGGGASPGGTGGYTITSSENPGQIELITANTSEAAGINPGCNANGAFIGTIPSGFAAVDSCGQGDIIRQGCCTN